MYKDGFSEFEVKQSSLKFADEEKAEPVGCVGSLEEKMNTKKITKKCEGVVVKNVRKGDGTGELKVTLHIRYPLFTKVFGMSDETLKTGVYSYGEKSVHPKASYTCLVRDEDGREKLKAYPNVTFDEFFTRKIENGAEEVAEVEATLAVEPDEHGQGLYEALVSEVTDDTVISQWIEHFTPELVKLTEI